jgi:small-conductance mechanosensitive channel
MFQFLCDFFVFPARTKFAAFILIVFSQVIFGETIPLFGSLPSHKSKLEKADLSDTDSAVSDSVAWAASDSVKNKIKVNDSLTQIDSVQKGALSDKLRNLSPGDISKQKEIESRLDSLFRSDSLRSEQQTMEIAQLRKTLIEYPVVLGNDTLFSIHIKIGSFTAKERAQVISNRIMTCAKSTGFKMDSLVSMPIESSNNILYGETILLSVTERDALWYGISADSLSRSYVTIMKTAIAAYRKDHAARTYLLQGIKLAGILLIAAVIIFIARKLFKYILRYITRNREKLIRGIILKNVTVLTKEKQYRLMSRMIAVLETVSYCIVGFIALPFLFSVFPWTRNVSTTILGWMVSPAKNFAVSVLHYLPNVFNIIIIIVVGLLLIKLFKTIFDNIEKGTIKFQGFYCDWARPTFNIVRFLVFVLMLVAIFPYLPGSNSPIFRAVAIFLGLLFSLGGTSAISNMVAGLVIIYMRPFKKGDWIKIGEVMGEVTEKNIVVTRLRTIKNEIITLPNSTVLNSHTINYSINGADLHLILHTTVTIAYDVPWRTIHNLLIDSALRTGRISKEKEPFVLQTSLDDFYVSYEVNAYTEHPKEMPVIYSELHQNIQDSFNAAGVEIMSPHYRSVRNGNRSTINMPVEKNE